MTTCRTEKSPGFRNKQAPYPPDISAFPRRYTLLAWPASRLATTQVLLQRLPVIGMPAGLQVLVRALRKAGMVEEKQGVIGVRLQLILDELKRQSVKAAS